MSKYAVINAVIILCSKCQITFSKVFLSMSNKVFTGLGCINGTMYVCT